MKYTFTLLALFLSAQVIGQTYLNETSRWKQYFRYSYYPPGVALIEDAWIQLDGDTTINGMTYFKVLKTGFDTFDFLQGGGTDSYGTMHDYLDPIREADQSIYAFSRTMNEEYLLYDYSAQVGDTLKSGNCERDTVISIDTLLLGNVPRKQFHLPAPYTADISRLVEGIGSTFGFQWHVCNIIPNPVVYLQCFCQDGACLKFYGNYDCSSLLVANEEREERAFSIHPNPFIDELEIHFSEALQQSVSLVIIDMMGAVVFNLHLSSADSIERIAIPDLATGLYIISVRHQDGIYSQKMMKL